MLVTQYDIAASCPRWSVTLLLGRCIHRRWEFWAGWQMGEEIRHHTPYQYTQMNKVGNIMTAKAPQNSGRCSTHSSTFSDVGHNSAVSRPAWNSMLSGEEENLPSHGPATLQSSQVHSVETSVRQNSNKETCFILTVR